MKYNILYAKDNAFLQPDIVSKSIRSNTSKVGEIEITSPDNAFIELNNDPRKYIKYPLPRFVGHTSMSVGDVLEANDKYYVCKSFGWEEIKK